MNDPETFVTIGGELIVRADRTAWIPTDTPAEVTQ